MYEIDFLPDWYRCNRRNRRFYHTQCIVMSCVFIVMVTWGFCSRLTLSNLEARTNRLVAEEKITGPVLTDIAAGRNELVSLYENAAILEKYGSPINVSELLSGIKSLSSTDVGLGIIMIDSIPIDRQNPGSKYTVLIKGTVRSCDEVTCFVKKLAGFRLFDTVEPRLLKRIHDPALVEFEIICCCTSDPGKVKEAVR
ncbi:MAG: hypothetical protein ABIG61_13635 [Planctomycetota bacterium]